LVEAERICLELLRSEGSRKVTHRQQCRSKRLAELALQVSLHAHRFDRLALDHRPNSICSVNCWHLSPAYLNQEFLSSFLCARLLDLLRHRFEYAQSLALGLSIQTSHRLAK